MAKCRTLLKAHCQRTAAKQTLHSVYHWLIPWTNITYAWYYQTFIVSPAFSIGVTALKLCMDIIDAKEYIIVGKSESMKVKPEFCLFKNAI